MLKIDFDKKYNFTQNCDFCDHIQELEFKNNNYLGCKKCKFEIETIISINFIRYYRQEIDGNLYYVYKNSIFRWKDCGIFLGELIKIQIKPFYIKDFPDLIKKYELLI